jgi:glycosyltransferase involved in cell wall biosynthesis
VTPEEVPRVSIIIPVFNQARDLARCLAALERQTYPPDRFDVIVVDNGSDEPIGPVAERFSCVRAISEPAPGSYAARNRGIEASRGALLAFTDADCLPAANWIECGVRAVQRLPGAGMVAGQIAMTFYDPDKPTAVELCESIFGLPQEMFLAWGFGATANLFRGIPQTKNVLGRLVLQRGERPPAQKDVQIQNHVFYLRPRSLAALSPRIRRLSPSLMSA